MLSSIEYDLEDYTVITDSEWYSEYKGDYRMVKFSTGVYGLQKLMTVNPLDINDKEYVTVLVSPVEDKTLDNGLRFPNGELMINEMFTAIKEANNSYNGSYWQLNLFLQDKNSVDKFIEIITFEEGNTLLEQLDTLFEAQREVNDYYFRNYPSC